MVFFTVMTEVPEPDVDVRVCMHALLCLCKFIMKINL